MSQLTCWVQPKISTSRSRVLKWLETIIILQSICKLQWFDATMQLPDTCWLLWRFSTKWNINLPIERFQVLRLQRPKSSTAIKSSKEAIWAWHENKYFRLEHSEKEEKMRKVIMTKNLLSIFGWIVVLFLKTWVERWEAEEAVEWNFLELRLRVEKWVIYQENQFQIPDRDYVSFYYAWRRFIDACSFLTLLRGEKHHRMSSRYF